MAYVGTIVTCCGRMIVPTRMVNRIVLPGIRTCENPYATTTAELTAPIVPMTAMATGLKNKRPKVVIFHASAKLDQCGLKFHTRSSVRQRPCHSMGCVGLVGSMNVLCSRPGLVSARRRTLPSSGTLYRSNDSPPYENWAGSDGQIG